MSAVNPLSGPHEFSEAIRDAGLTPPDVIEPGKLHRFPGAGKRPANRAGWCLLFNDGLGGCYGDWSSGLYETWQAGRDKPFSKAERATFARRVEDAKRRAEAERLTRQADAAKRARGWWAESKPAQPSHPYLTTKRIASHGLRQSLGLLLVPLIDTGGSLWNLQTISAGGTKLFMRGGRISGLFSVVGNATGAPERLLICEGWATAATLHEEIGAPVLAAMNAGNLLPVAKAACQTWPQADITVCGDDDRHTPGNPGRIKATKAAAAINARLAFPEFAPDEPGSDFNDWAINRCGVAA